MTEDQRKTFINSAAESALKAQQETDAAEGPKTPQEWTPSEALFAFMGWLTTRKEPTILGSGHDAAPAVELIREFTERHHLEHPREGYHLVIVHDPNR